MPKDSRSLQDMTEMLPSKRRHAHTYPFIIVRIAVYILVEPLHTANLLMIHNTHTF